jgi:hypothetical protein
VLWTVPALILLAVAAQTQDLRLPPPDIGMAEAAYREAEEAWLHNDPTLEQDLLKVRPEEALRRIRRQSALRDDVMAKKQTYLDELIRRVGGLKERLTQGTQGNIPAASIRKDLEQQQARILEEQDRLEQLIADLPPGDEYTLVRRPLAEERIRLVNLQNNIAQRIRSIDSLDKSQEAISAASKDDPLARNLEAELKMWQDARDANANQRKGWQQVYAEMEKAVTESAAAGAGGSSAVKNGVHPPKGKDKPATATPSSTPPQTSQHDTKPGLAGVWKYRSQPNAWTGYAEPAAVTLELREEHGILRGLYTARLPVKSETHPVQLTLESTQRSATAATMHWKSASPVAEGDMELKLAADGRLLVERVKSGDSYIPLGSEVLSLK